MKTAIHAGLGTVILFFGGFGGWAALAPLDGAVVGTGRLVVQGNRKTVQHREGGIVEALAVREGDRVSQGQVLIRLDPTQALASLHVHQAALAGDQALSARALAEIAEADGVAFPPSLSSADPVAASVMAREMTVFRSHRTLLRAQLAVLAERMAQARQQGEGARAQYQAARRSLDLATQELAAYAQLAKTGLASRTHVLEIARNVEELRGETGAFQAEIARHGAEADELAAEALRVRQNAASDATHELREAQLRINDVLPRIAADQDTLARLEIRAPASGEVVDQTVFTRGAVVEPGKPILDIVPASPRIVAEAEIRPEDIEYLHTGQAARVVVTGFNPRETQPLEARIDVLSADRVTDQRTGRAFYRAEFGLLADREGGQLLHQLAPGMPVEVIVPVQPRTALEYLAGPFLSTIRHAGRET